MENIILTPATIDQFIGLLRDTTFCNLRRLTEDHPLPWGEFCKLDTPNFLSREQTWNILNEFRRQTAIELPFRDGEGRVGWYQSTHALREALDDIDRRCHENSWIDLVIKSRNPTHFLIETYVDDALAALSEDGLDLGYEKARAVLLHERKPKTDGEILLHNSLRAQRMLDSFTSKPCTPDLIFDFYEIISHNIGKIPTHPEAQESTVWKHSKLDSTEALNLACRMVDRERFSFVEHPLLLATGIRHLLMSTLPLPAWNCTVSALLIKLLFKKSNLPALALIPFAKTWRAWETGITRPPQVLATIQEAQVPTNGEVDYTIYVHEVARLTRRNLDAIEEELKDIIKQDEVFSRALREDLDINHRQRTVLQEALNNPEAVFRIESHQERQRVAYATARADLMGLADAGFLRCVKGKRAFDFRVVPGLHQLLPRRNNEAEA